MHKQTGDFPGEVFAKAILFNLISSYERVLSGLLINWLPYLLCL